MKKNEVKTVAEHSNALFGSGITLRISRHGRLGTLANSCLSPDLTTFAVTWGPVPTWTICGLIGTFNPTRVPSENLFRLHVAL